MNIQRQIIKRVKKGQPYSLYFMENGDVYRRGMSDADQIDFHIADLQAIAQNGVSRFGLIAICLKQLTDNLKAMKESYGAVEEAERTMNGE